LLDGIPAKGTNSCYGVSCDHAKVCSVRPVFEISLGKAKE
jgi:hypothetical protein